MSTNPYESPEPVTAQLRPPNAMDAERIVLSGTLKVSDVMHAQRLAERAFVSRTFFGVLLPIALLGLLLLTDFRSPTRPPFLFSRGALMIACMTLPVAYVLGHVRRYWSYSRQSRQRLGVFASSQTEVTPEGLWTVSEHAESRIKWSFFRGYRASDRVIVLYVQFPAQFLVISRDKLENAGQWPDLVQLVQRNLPQS